MARGKRPDPFRTRKLSLSAPMVLLRGRGGRVGRRRTTIRNGGQSHVLWPPFSSVRQFCARLPEYAPQQYRPARRAGVDLLYRPQADRLQGVVVQLAPVVLAHSSGGPAHRNQVELPAIPRVSPLRGRRGGVRART